MITLRTHGVYESLSEGGGPGSGAAGWGAMFLRNGICLGTNGGPLSGISGSTDAEIAAMSVGLSFASAREILDTGATVKIETPCREVVAILLNLIPGSTCVGASPIPAAGSVRSATRNADTTINFVRMVARLNLTLVFEIRPSERRALEEAREGMRRARASA